MLPTFENVIQMYNEEREQVIFLSIELPKFESNLQELLRKQENNVTIDGKGCAPLFIVVRCKQCVGFIQGADPPSFLRLIKENLPQTVKCTDDACDEQENGTNSSS